MVIIIFGMCAVMFYNTSVEKYFSDFYFNRSRLYYYSVRLLLTTSPKNDPSSLEVSDSKNWNEI